MYPRFCRLDKNFKVVNWIDVNDLTLHIFSLQEMQNIKMNRIYSQHIKVGKPTRIIKVTSKSNEETKTEKRNEITELWQGFCDNTAIVGLRHIGGKKRVKNFYSVIWVVVWLSQLALCTWLCSDLVLRYLKFNTKTSTTYNTVDELPFPAITICNQNTFRRTMVGGNMAIMVAMASYYAKNY